MQISPRRGSFKKDLLHSFGIQVFRAMDEMSTVKPRLAIKDKPEVLVIMILATWEIYLTVRVQE